MKVFGKGVCMYGVCVMEECGEFVYHPYVLQGGGGGDETVETGMKLTRSLQSGSEASLQGMGQQEGAGRKCRLHTCFGQQKMHHQLQWTIGRAMWRKGW